tara:strand:+ start:145 stop:300 length:156 start_codon:yes stop_codon:yes gene_type:complete
VQFLLFETADKYYKTCNSTFSSLDNRVIAFKGNIASMDALNKGTYFKIVLN